jgi:hypothetical protein
MMSGHLAFQDCAWNRFEKSRPNSWGNLRPSPTPRLPSLRPRSVQVITGSKSPSCLKLLGAPPALTFSAPESPP